MKIDPPVGLNNKEKHLVEKFCPILLTQPSEPFSLKDVAAVFHPTKPIIGYHLFWEDDYDFPDDNEPSDHEEVWIEYNPKTETVKKVYAWFHSRVIESSEAVTEAMHHNQRAIIRIEWGKHGSLLKGWENMYDSTGISYLEWMKATFERLKQGGRVKHHPLKNYWPEKFVGTFDDYIMFSKKIEPLEWLQKKPLMYKSQWVNAVLFTHCIHYNFHPKMGWPDRCFS